jgi:hypothetical protein
MGFVFFSVKQSAIDKEINNDINTKVDVINNKIDVITRLLNSEKKPENNNIEKQTIQPNKPTKGPVGSPVNTKTKAIPPVLKKKSQVPEN